MKLLLVFCLLAFTINGFAQDAPKGKTIEDIKKQAKKFKNGGRYKVEYDKFEDKTRVAFTGFYLTKTGEMMVGMMRAPASAPPPSLVFLAAFSFEGKELTKTTDSLLIGFVWRGNEFRFEKDSRLFVLADGERFYFGHAEKDYDYVHEFFFSGQFQETMLFEISTDDLLKIANAKKAEMRLGKREQELKDEHKQMLKDMIALAKLE